MYLMCVYVCQLNDDYYECLTPASTIELLKACQAGKPPPMGKWGSLPMNGQVSCEGPQGKTSLFEAPPGPGAHMRPDSELEPKVSMRELTCTCARVYMHRRVLGSFADWIG